MEKIKAIIENAFKCREEIQLIKRDLRLNEAINQVITKLDKGQLRVANKIDGQWITHQWIKKAVLLFFYINDNRLIEGAESNYFDKITMKFSEYDHARFQKEGFRVVPPATARKGAFIAKNTVLMPSYVNIGSYID
ncbi:MAG: 2,3,4,5-tetrahydropyridine-2,6-dicarboxylate N-succinyltransferase, partial [Arsenophonus sp. ET-DL12-MAG3]